MGPSRPRNISARGPGARGDRAEGDAGGQADRKERGRRLEQHVPQRDVGQVGQQDRAGDDGSDPEQCHGGGPKNEAVVDAPVGRDDVVSAHYENATTKQLSQSLRTGSRLTGAGGARAGVKSGRWRGSGCLGIHVVVNVRSPRVDVVRVHPRWVTRSSARPLQTDRNPHRSTRRRCRGAHVGQVGNGRNRRDGGRGRSSPSRGSSPTSWSPTSSRTRTSPSPRTRSTSPGRT